MEDSTIEDSPKQRNWPIYLYIPNIIGYARIIANVAAFGVAFTNKKLFAILYFASFVCDELDGRFARMFNQKSTFGAVLDMVTDRVSTAALLVLLTHFYKSHYGLFLGLLALDISSHWLQMFSTHLSSKASHKDMGDSKSTLLRLYYQHRYFMGYCAIGAEVARHAVAERTVYGIVLVIALPGCAIKQLVNLVQMKTAADVCVRYDTHRYSSKSQ
ncbi:probable CDP-diacylglycerol--inositol 3-phosphatidyltransferase 2 isoform X2 [Physcomitrium patens]|uniref:CDP-diacylglycerol--inositol 3-phosphatidyltransferase n=1 Tax=Physcomitrium patens TaxID=3218 RepID=A0A7I4DA40_PHYPA|nr:probable CDP-diacylglycerol--inositol 3-phosphatidyltransferase 2 isoform X2 [Physcomitrium patens]|eukprot:XP_024369464.1 probable CDP-diacylglycerol--inositol 3-phosphatidyltransferase 2 isoform X2 [Physcomitrella patens]